MSYVTAIPHMANTQMLRTTFVCYHCNQTKTYMLSAAMAKSYTATA